MLETGKPVFRLFRCRESFKPPASKRMLAKAKMGPPRDHIENTNLNTIRKPIDIDRH